RRAEVEVGGVKSVAQGLGFKVHGRIDQVRRMADTQLLQAEPLPGLGRRMIDLEDAQLFEQVAAAMGKGIETGSEDHVLADTSSDALLDEVLRQACSDAKPPTKGAQIFRRQFHAQPPRYLIAITAGEQERELVVQHPWRRLLAMQSPHRGR